MTCEFDTHVKCDMCLAEDLLCSLLDGVNEAVDEDIMLVTHLRHLEESFTLGVNREVANSLQVSDYGTLDEFHPPESFTEAYSMVNVVYAQESLVGAVFSGIGAAIGAVFKMIGSILSGIASLISWIFGGKTLEKTANDANKAKATLDEINTPIDMYKDKDKTPEIKKAYDDLAASHTVAALAVSSRVFTYQEVVANIKTQVTDSVAVNKAVADVLASIAEVNRANGTSSKKAVAESSKVIKAAIKDIIKTINSKEDIIKQKAVNLTNSDLEASRIAAIRSSCEKQRDAVKEVEELPKNIDQFTLSLTNIASYVEGLDKAKMSGEGKRLTEASDKMAKYATEISVLLSGKQNIDKSVLKHFKSDLGDLRNCLRLLAILDSTGAYMLKATTDASRKFCHCATAYTDALKKHFGK